eukprot:gb/GECH01011524.1/.p1 GENE.gb/GECH01011524.1/~~gb/GECH01011524.1/.p1  ORF type:complete len:375 (+),score=66.40 gb/GECH01011524.1/:1-1125(+)
MQQQIAVGGAHSLSPSPEIIQDWSSNLTSSNLESRVEELLAAADRKAQEHVTRQSKPNQNEVSTKENRLSTNESNPSSPQTKKPPQRQSRPKTPPPHLQQRKKRRRIEQRNRKDNQEHRARGHASMDVMGFKEQEVVAQLQALDQALAKTRKKWSTNQNNKNRNQRSLNDILRTRSNISKHHSPPRSSVKEPRRSSSANPTGPSSRTKGKIEDEEIKEKENHPTHHLGTNDGIALNKYSSRRTRSKSREPRLRTSDRAKQRSRSNSQGRSKSANNSARKEQPQQVSVDLEKLLVEREEIDRVLKSDQGRPRRQAPTPPKNESSTRENFSIVDTRSTYENAHSLLTKQLGIDDSDRVPQGRPPRPPKRKSFVSER